MKKLFLLLVLATPAILFADDAAEVQQPAPTFSLSTLEGEPFDLANTQGKVVYLDFWASWCGPCKISFPDMIKLQNEFQDEGVSIVTVSVDKDIKKAIKFVSRYDVNFVVLHDAGGNVATLYDLPAMPTTYLLDRQGTIQHVHEGYRPGDYGDLRDRLLELTHDH